MIAASALSLGVPLVTRNTAEVDGLGVALLARRPCGKLAEASPTPREPNRRTIRPAGRGTRSCETYLVLLDADLWGGSFHYSDASQQCRFWVHAPAPKPQPASPHRLRGKPRNLQPLRG